MENGIYFRVVFVKDVLNATPLFLSLTFTHQRMLLQEPMTSFEEKNKLFSGCRKEYTWPVVKESPRAGGSIYPEGSTSHSMVRRDVTCKCIISILTAWLRPFGAMISWSSQ